MMPVEIVGRRDETADIAVFELAAPAGASLPPFTAGAHIDVEIKPGLVRPYSLCALGNEAGTYRIGVLKERRSRGGSTALHRCHAGDMLRISTPRNNFPLASDGAPSLLFAGGIGVTPMLAMAAELHTAGRPFALHYCARSQASAAFLDELAAAPFSHCVTLHFDDGAAEDKLHIGQFLVEASVSTQVYVCGPAGFMEWIIAASEAAGFPQAQIHREYFKAPETQQTGDNFTIRLASSGVVLDVPGDRSIVAVLRDHGIEVPVSCESGVCGTCITGVREGVPDHRDFYLTAEEKARGDVMLLCCSRAKSRLLALDL